MFKNYLKIAFRNIRRHKIDTLINIFGMSIGMAFFILAYLFVSNELSYDNFHKQGNHIYRVYENKQRSGKSASTAQPLGATLKNKFPEIEAMVRFDDYASYNHVVHYQEKTFKEHLIFTDTSCFEMFSFPFLYGNPKTALAQKNNVVLSRQAARKYFGEINPIGQIISIKEMREDRFHDFFVTGVVEDIPANSTIRFDFLLPYENKQTLLNGPDGDAWFCYSWITIYVRLNKGANLIALEEKLPAFVKKYFIAPWGNIDVSLHLQPLSQIHFSGDIAAPSREKIGQPAYSFILMGLALLVLFIACMNFINLAVAHSSLRTREVGIRKTIGAQGKQLMFQFLTEFLIVLGCALTLGLLFAVILLPAFNGFIANSLSLSILLSPMRFLVFVSCVSLVYFVVSIYPAFIMARLQPTQIIQNKLKIGGANWFGRALVIFQFALSIMLIVSALIMMWQVQYIKHKDIGFNTEQVLVIATDGIKNSNFQFLGRFRNEINQRHDIISVSGINQRVVGGQMGESIQNKMGEEIEFSVYFVDDQFLKTLGIELIGGRNFSTNFGSDLGSSIIINETLAKKMGLDKPVGETMRFQAHTAMPHPITRSYALVTNPTVIGVIRDYHFNTLHETLGPIALFFNPYSIGGELLVKIRPDNIRETISFLEKKWKEIAPDIPFEFYFLDDAVDQQYRTENLWAKVIVGASIVAIFIACLGSFGLIALAANRRTKEIGIRKILGSSILGILNLLIKEQIILVLLANLIAWPVAYYAMDKWLQDFAYRIDITIWPFLLAGILALVIALLTVSYQAIKAATRNPVESLRYE